MSGMLLIRKGEKPREICSVCKELQSAAECPIAIAGKRDLDYIRNMRNLIEADLGPQKWTVAL